MPSSVQVPHVFVRRQCRGGLPARAATAVSLAAAAAVTAAAILAPDAVHKLGPWLLAGGILLGLPHGAVDHLAPAWAAGRPARRPGLGLLAGYSGGALAALAALLLAPLPTVLALLVVSAVHFGLGEVVFAAERPGDRWRPTVSDLSAVIGLGGLPIALPLARWAEQTDPVLAEFSPQLPAVFSRGLRTGLATLVAGCLAVTVVSAARSGRRLSAVESCLLAGLFLAVPPLAAFGVYFGAWHAPRHVARLLDSDPRNAGDLAAGRLWPPLRRYIAAAAAPTLVALTGIAGLVGAAREPQWAAPALAALLGLTVPHVAVVAAFDRSRRFSAPRCPCSHTDPDTVQVT